MVEMTKEVMELFNDPKASKVLATVDGTGNVNVVPKGSLAAVDKEMVVFADIFGGKTRENLEGTGKVAATVFNMGMPPVGYQIKGAFQGFQTSGDLFDNYAKMIKEIMKMDIKGVGMIKVEEVFAVGPPSAGRKLA